MKYLFLFANKPASNEECHNTSFVPHIVFCYVILHSVKMNLILYGDLLDLIVMVSYQFVLYPTKTYCIQLYPTLPSCILSYNPLYHALT